MRDTIPPTQFFRMALAILATSSLVACGDTTAPTAAPDLSSGLFASVNAAPFAVNASEITLAPAGTFQLGATKTANGQAVPDPSVQWSTANALIASVSETGLVTGNTVGTTIVTASRGSHSVDVTVHVDGCGINFLTGMVTTGALTATDCMTGTSYIDIYSVNTSVGEIIEFEAGGAVRHGVRGGDATSLTGIFGNVAGGSLQYAAPVRVVGTGRPIQYYVRSPALGAYTILRTAPAEAHDCAVYPFILPGSATTTQLTAANSCHYPVAYGSIPQAVGKPLHAHTYNFVAEAGKSYTVTVSGLSDAFDVALTVFGGGVHGQSAPTGGAAPSSRTVTFSVPSTRFVAIEVSSGRFIGGLAPENWTIQHGTYSLTFQD